MNILSLLRKLRGWPTRRYPQPEWNLKVVTGRDHITQRTSMVIVNGIGHTVNDFAGEVLLHKVEPGIHTVEFGPATHPIWEYKTPPTLTVIVGDKQETMFGKYYHVPIASAGLCGLAGTVNDVVKTGQKIHTVQSLAQSKGKVDELVPVGRAGVLVYAWWPPQRSRYGSPRYPWRHWSRQGFNPKYLYTAVTDEKGRFYFRDLPIPPGDAPFYCVGFAGKGGGERTFRVHPGTLEPAEIFLY